MSEIFMCYAEGKSRPKKNHATLELAMVEAERLSGLENTPGRIFVLTDIAVFEKKPEIIVAPVVTVKKKRLLVLP